MFIVNIKTIEYDISEEKTFRHSGNTGDEIFLFSDIIRTRWCRSSPLLTFDSPSLCLRLLHSRDNNTNQGVAPRSTEGVKIRSLN